MTPGALRRLAIGWLNFQFRHQKQIKNTVVLIFVMNNDSSPRRGSGDEITMAHFERPAICHADRKWLKRVLMQRGLKLFGRHI
jgi:hypothetical protein